MNNEELNNLSNSNPYNNNSSLNETFDDLEEEKKRLEEDKERIDSSNIFKVRIIDAEINSNLTLQILMYFNYFYLYVCFALEISFICYRTIIFKGDALYWIKFSLLIVWFIIEHIKLYNGYYGNINENVIDIYFIISYIVL